MKGDIRTRSSCSRSSRSSPPSPPISAKSSSMSSVMNCGSIAMALSAEYGEVSPGGISLIGSSCRRCCPADSSHRVIGSMSPISPMPQLRDDGIENSGTRIPARREPDRACGIRALVGREPQHAARRVGKRSGWEEQTHHYVGLPRKVEEIPWMHEDAFAFEQLQHQLLLRAVGRHPHHSVPPSLAREHLARTEWSSDLSKRVEVQTQECFSLFPHRAAARQQLAGSDLDGRRHRQIAVCDQFERVQRLVALRGGATNDDPPELELRQACGFGQSTERERKWIDRQRDVGDTIVWRI